MLDTGSSAISSIMNNGSAESADSSSQGGPPAPRIPLPRDLTANHSYVDLFEAYAQEHDLQVEEVQNHSSAHHYPVIMQSMITRLEKYGRLANMRDLARHSRSSRGRKTKPEEPLHSSSDEGSDPNDRYYDLDDAFIAPEDCDPDKETEGDFDTALSEGHYVLPASLFVPQPSRPASLTQKRKPSQRAAAGSGPVGRKKKARAVSAYPEEIKKRLFALQEMYEKNKQETNVVAYPKGALKIIGEILVEMLNDEVCDMQSIERTELCLTLSEISDQSLTRIEKIVEKQLLVNEKAKAGNQFAADAKRLKSLINAECRTLKPSWTDPLKDALAVCKLSLEANVRKTNEFNSGYNKKRGSLAFQDEEKKLEKDVSDWSAGRFLLNGGDVRVVLPSTAPTPIVPSQVLVSAGTQPRRGSQYDKMPE